MNRNKPAIGSAQDHLSLAVLRRYQEGLLPAPEEHRVERHLLDCDLCADILAGMEQQSSRQTGLAVQEIHQRLAAARGRKKGVLIPLFSQRNLAVAATMLLLLCSAGLVFFYNLEKVKQATEVPVATHKPAPGHSARQPEPAATVGPPVAASSAPRAGTTIPPVRERPEELLAAKQGGLAASGQAPEMALADVSSAENEDISVQVLPPATMAPSMMPDSGVAGNGAIAAARTKPLQRQAAGAMAKTSTMAQVRNQEMARVAATDAPAGKTISGRVLDAAGEPLPGVTVLLQGTTQGTVTNQEGKYTLPIPQSTEEATLTYNFIGYAPLEKKVSTQALAGVDVILAADTRALSEVAVMGYGKEGKSTADASPVGGWNNFKQHLKSNLRHPAEADGAKVSGRVVIGFTVNADGSLGDVRVLKSLSPATDAEALRLVQQGPRWQPAKAGPQPVRVSIRFRAVR
jgi:TonB family protein